MTEEHWLGALLLQSGASSRDYHDELLAVRDVVSAWELESAGSTLAWLCARLAGSRSAMQELVVVSANCLLGSCLRPWVRTHLRGARMQGALRRARRVGTPGIVESGNTDSATAARSLLTAGADLARAYASLQGMEELDWRDPRARALPDRIYDALSAGNRALGYGGCASFGAWVGEVTWADAIRARLMLVDVGDAYPRVVPRGDDTELSRPPIPLGLVETNRAAEELASSARAPRVGAPWTHDLQDDTKDSWILEEVAGLGRYQSIPEAWMLCESPVALTYMAGRFAADDTARAELVHVVAEDVEVALDPHVLELMRSSRCSRVLKRIARRELTQAQAREFIEGADVAEQVTEAVHQLSYACDTISGWLRKRPFRATRCADACAHAVWHAERSRVLAARRAGTGDTPSPSTTSRVRHHLTLVETTPRVYQVFARSGERTGLH